MPGNAGSLIVSLGLDAAQYFAGIASAQADTAKFTKAVGQQFTQLQGTLRTIGGSLAGYFSARAVVDWAKELSAGTERLNDLVSATGSTVENLSRLQNQVKYSGASFEQFEAVILRLAAGMNGSEELSTKTAKALQFLGVQAKDPALALNEIAVKLNQYADSSAKAAIARDLFGKSGPAFLDALKEIANAQDIVNTRTQQQADNAEALNKAFRRLTIEGNDLKNAFLNDVAPAIERVARALTLAIQASGGSFFGGIKAFIAAQGGNPFNDFSKLALDIRDAREELGRLQAKRDEVAKNPPFNERFSDALGLQHGSETDRLDREIQKQKDKIAVLVKLQNSDPNIGAKANEDSIDRRLNQKPLLAYVSDSGKAADDAARKILEGQLKALDNFIADERDRLQARQQFLQDTYQDGYLSIKQYYDQVASAREQSLQATIAAYDKEIAATEAYAAKVKNEGKASEFVDAQNKVADIKEKQAKAIREASQAADVAERDRSRANEQWGFQLDELTARAAELRGDLAQAADIRFNVQNTVLRRQLTSAGNQTGLGTLDQEQRVLRSQTLLNQATRDYNFILQDVSNAQARVQIQAQAGNLSEFKSLTALSEIAASQLPALAEQISKAQDNVEELMRTLGPDNPKTKEALNTVEQLKLKYEELAATGDLLAKKFNQDFATAFESNLAALVKGQKSLKDAVKGFFTDVAGSITDNVIKNLGQELFSGNNAPLGFLGSFFSALFGGKKGDNGAAALNSAGAVLATAGTELSLAATALLTSASAITASSAASEGFKGFGSFTSLFGGGWSNIGGGGPIIGEFPGGGPGYAAAGTAWSRNGWYVVGEKGPELVRLPAGASVTPANYHSATEQRGMTQVFQSYTLPGANTQTARHAAKLVSDRMSYARRRG